MLDASIFSRAMSGMNVDDLKKLQADTDVLILGRGTSMTGTILGIKAKRTDIAKDKLDNGKLIEKDTERDGLYYYRVAAGAKFSDVISTLSSENMVPAIFPLYLEGTVGGFVATNGSGFGSYRYGFVSFKKKTGELIDNNVAKIAAVPYMELIETDYEVDIAWSGLIIQDAVKYYVPQDLAEKVGINGKPVKISEIIAIINSMVSLSFSREYIPVILRGEVGIKDKIPNFFTPIIGYVIKYNSPDAQNVILGKVKQSELDELFKFLKKETKILPFPSLTTYTEVHKKIMNDYKGVKIPTKYVSIKDAFLDATMCINCGKCIDTCKAFEVSRNLDNSAVGRLNRVSIGETDFLPCFGCTRCEEVCPVGIKISSITEILPRLSKERKIEPIETSPATPMARSLEAKIDEKYRNRPPVLLFVGCTSKYDPVGLEGFLQFLLDYGDELKASPRARLIDDISCSFNKYVAGDVEGAKNELMKIVEKKKINNAESVYFLCPEEMYVYQNLIDKNVKLGYELLKDKISVNIHKGCWLKKLGIVNNSDECAGNYYTVYMNNLVKSYIRDTPVCPFASWKTGKPSVYALFRKNISEEVKTQAKVNKELNLSEIFYLAIREATLNSAEYMADKLNNWKLGGRNFYKSIITPYVKKELYVALVGKLKTIKDELKERSIDDPYLQAEIDKAVDEIKGMSWEPLLMEIRNRVINSAKLDYLNRTIAESKEFLDVLSEIASSMIQKNIIIDAIRTVYYS
ncbi:hypothetical protein HS7_16590 [Sulfolobales archaeon HS-7]|nr:hypothetical protein HS7_16590 [Sulfolobales archaeon HS-7]